MRIYRPTWKANGRRVTGSKYWAQFGHQGKVYNRALHTSDKRVAERKARKLKEEIELEAAGIVDPFKKQRNRPLHEHVSEFLAYLASKDVSAGHVADRTLSLREYLEATSARVLQQIDFAEAQRWLADLGERAERPLSARSINKRYQALRQFGAWIVRTRRLGHDPFAALRKRNEETDRRRERRALTHDEVERLLDVARKRPLGDAQRQRVRAGVSQTERARLDAVGESRAFLYRFALGTGLRRGELKALVWADIAPECCSLIVRASVSKRRRRDDLPLQPGLVQGLATHHDRVEARGLPAGSQDLVFPGPLFPVHRTFRRDLEAAGLAEADDRGRVVDFHSFRVTFITQLLVAGVHPRTVQALARHSKIDLTMRVYTDVRLLNRRAAVELLDTPRQGRGGTSATG